MQNIGKLIKMEVLTKEVKLNSLNQLISSLERLSNLISIENIKTQVRLERTATEVIPLDRMAKVSKMALTGQQISWLYREEPLNKKDSGWRMYHGEESDEYMEDPTNFVGLTLAEIISESGNMTDVVHAQVGTQYEWFDEFDKFVELD